MKIVCALLVMACCFSAHAAVGFREGETRVSNSYDVLRFLYWKFRLPEEYKAAENSCEQMGFTEHIIAGTVISTLQARLVNGPEPSFEEWYAGCVDRFAQVKVELSANAAFEREWADLTPAERKQFVSDRVWEWIGPEFVLRDLGLIGPASTLIGKPAGLPELVELLLGLKVERTEGLPVKVSDAYRFFAVVLLTLPEVRIY